MYIYALVDPRDASVRYVGASANLTKRLSLHMRQPNRVVYKVWLGDLIAVGLAPDVVILEDVAPDTTWQSREKHWIAFHRNAGAPLANVRSGGEGGHGSKQQPRSESHRQNLSRALMDHAVSPEQARRTVETRNARGFRGSKYRPPRHCARCGEWTEDTHGKDRELCARCYTNTTRRAHCVHGHPYPEDLIVGPKRKRRCPTCRPVHVNAAVAMLLEEHHV